MLILCLFASSAFAQNKAFSVEGSNKNYITIPHFTTPAELTVEAWIRIPNVKGTKTIVCWKNVTSNADAVLFRIYDEKLQFGEWISSRWRTVESAASIRANEWTHVAVTRKGTTAKCYVNGVLSGESSSMSNTPQSVTDRLTIGAITTTPSESFVGYIDEVRIWDVERSAVQIASSYLTELTGAEGGLAGYWQLDENAGDKSTNGRNGTVTGNALYVDRFTTVVPSLQSIAFVETSSSTPYIEVNADQPGTVYWAVTAGDVTSLTASEILGGDSKIVTSASSLYSSPNVAGKLGFSRTLTVGSSYRVHAVIVNSEGQLSESRSSQPFTYQGLSSLPDGWHNTDIGTVTNAGITEYANNIFTVSGSGTGISGTADQFHMAYREYKGDVEITAKLVSVSGANSTAAVMIRESSDAGARYIAACITAGQAVTYRRSDAGASVTAVTLGEKSSSGWLKVIRKGGFVASYYSADGIDWKEIYFPQSIEFNETTYIGLAVSSNDGETSATAIFEDVTVSVPGEDVYLSDRGVYFYKKKYTPEPIPTYSASKHLLPVPVIDDNQGWLDLYNKTWQIAFSNIKAPVSGSPFVSNWLDEAFDSNIFQWDMIFMTMFSKYSHHIFPGIQSFDNFYCRQKISGSICRAINEVTGNDWFDESSSNLINPPLFSWAEVEYYQATGDKSRFEYILPVLEKYFEFVENARVGKSTQHQLYWSNGQASGMDNTPRDTGRPGGHYASDEQGWVDMSSQMVIQCNNIATICEELGYTEKAERYRTKANEIAQRINQWQWNETDGIYYDVNVQGVQTNWKTAGSFWPMLAGITTPEQAARLVDHLKNPDEFWREMVFPSLSASHAEYKSNGGYWRGAIWAPTNCAIIKGLETAGYNEFAKEASERYVQGIYEVFLQTGTLWENYAPDRTEAGILNPGVHDYSEDYFCRKDFVGWTGLGPISLLIENILGFRMNGADKVLTYYLQRTDRHGIQNLTMADVTTSVITENRKADENQANITVESDKPYTLVIIFKGEEYTYDIIPGTNNISITAPVKVANHTEPFDFKLHNNPVEDILTVEMHSVAPQWFTFKLFDLLGRVAAYSRNYVQEGISIKQIDMENLQSAVYFLSVESAGNRNMVCKIVKK